MANINIPNVFVNNTTADATQVDANFSEVQNKFNTYAVQVDVAKTITVTHTWSASQTFSAGLSTGAAITFTAGTGQVISGASGFSVRDSTNAFDNLFVDNSGGVTTRGNATVSGTLQVNSTSTFLNNLTVQLNGANAQIRAQRTTSNPSIIEMIAQDTQVRIRGYNAGNDKNILFDTDNAGTTRMTINGSTGLVTLANGLTVSTGGATITGNSSITGNLTVSGTVTAVGGSNTYVRRTTDLTFTTGSDSTLTFAVLGTSDEWEAEYVLFHTNGSAATMAATFAGPTGVSPMLFGGFDALNANVAAVSSGAISGTGNALVSFTMNSTMAMTVIRLYVKAAATSGNVTMNLAASAGTGTLKAGSFVRYSRIA